MALKIFKRHKTKKKLDPACASTFEEMRQKYITYEAMKSNYPQKNGLYSHFKINVEPVFDPDFGPVIAGSVETFHEGVHIFSNGTFETLRAPIGTKLIPNDCGYVHVYISYKNIKNELEHIALYISGSYHRCQIITTSHVEPQVFASYYELPKPIRDILEIRDRFLLSVNPTCEFKTKSNSVLPQPTGPLF